MSEPKSIKTQFRKQYDVEYLFRVRRSADGNFKNLWTLEVKAPGDSEYLVEVDNDSLSMVVDRMGYLFEMDGF